MSDSPQVPPVSAQSGISDSAAGALAYVTFVPAIVFLLVEPYNRSSFVKFHAWQSIFFTIACFVLWFVDMILAFIPVIGVLLMAVIGLGIIALWIVCVLKAINGQKFVIPVIGPLAEKQAGS